MCSKRLGVIETQEEQRHLPTSPGGSGRYLQVTSVQIHPAVSLGRLEAHARAQTQAPVQVLDRDGEVGDRDRGVVESQGNTPRVHRYCALHLTSGDETRGKIWEQRTTPHPLHDFSPLPRAEPAKGTTPAARTSAGRGNVPPWGLNEGIEIFSRDDRPSP